MRILAISDMHGNLANAGEAIRITRPDLTLCCGDWGDPGRIDPRALDAILAQSPMLSVYGNHDDLDLLSPARNRDGTPVLLAPGEVREREGLRFAGISGIWAMSHRKPYYVTDEDVERLTDELADRRVDVLLSHGCPAGLADTMPPGRHGGQRCFLNAFHTIRPRLYICGHLHVPQQRVLKGGQVIINAGYTCEGDYWLLDIRPDHIDFERHSL
jgi:uncharacterized protein